MLRSSFFTVGGKTGVTVEVEDALFEGASAIKKIYTINGLKTSPRERTTEASQYVDSKQVYLGRKYHRS